MTRGVGICKKEIMESENMKTTRLKEWIPLIEESLKQGKTVRFAPRGISMLPMLRQGIDCVILSPLPEKLKKYDLPLYQREDGKYILHRIVKVGETYTCIGDNQFEMEPGYRLYCRVWHYSRSARLVIRKIRRIVYGTIC